MQLQQIDEDRAAEMRDFKNRGGKQHMIATFETHIMQVKVDCFPISEE